MKVLIIEDEAPAFRRLQKIIEEVDPSLEIIDVIDSVEESIKWLEVHDTPDLIFMDIQLSDGLSFEIFEQHEVKSPVIFTTAFDEYLLEAFKVNSIDYLLKPIKAEELAKSLNKLSAMRKVLGAPDQPNLTELLAGMDLGGKRFKRRFLVKQGGKMLSIPTNQIAYFTTRNGVVYLVTFEETKHILDATLDDLSKQLNPEDFYRANRQFLINYDLVKSVEKYHKGKLIINTQIPTPEAITISEEKASFFKRWLDN